ncbi:(2Fe-2S)-binding protein [Aquidulcibacter paucihalophilus]|uniref:(2Fe-2S)-binding protein n=1 Tax=Aquidulcibacter paucihalophilus TaxID=1978549 RepID=UPI000A18F71B|nr:(2Fe-2S)-binding protein [Aquidulcibacter paucihalophilus]
MYVCNCNGIREKAVQEAIAAGAGRPCDIFHAHQCRAQCGRCVPEMQEMIERQTQQFKVAAE